MNDRVSLEIQISSEYFVAHKNVFLRIHHMLHLLFCFHLVLSEILNF